MRPHQIFSAMSPADSERIMGRISEETPDFFRQTVAAAAMSLKFRPQFLRKQPLAKRIAAVRRSLARPAASSLAEELFAVYFLRCRLDLLTSWLDLLGLSHEEGVLNDAEAICPEAAKLGEIVSSFRASKDQDCDLLLQAFASQEAIEWPALDALLEAKAN
ncbi:MAG: hypothetical protein VCB25_12660 [Myxococcota bacterium]